MQEPIRFFINFPTRDRPTLSNSTFFSLIIISLSLRQTQDRVKKARPPSLSSSPIHPNLVFLQHPSSHDKKQLQLTFSLRLFITRIISQEEGSKPQNQNYLF